jgi:hypothetical protein
MLSFYQTQPLLICYDRVLTNALRTDRHRNSSSSVWFEIGFVPKALVPSPEKSVFFFIEARFFQKKLENLQCFWNNVESIKFSLFQDKEAFE